MSFRNRAWFNLAVIVAFSVLLTVAVAGGVPQKVNYQGRLTDSVTGEPKVGTRNVIFRIYDDAASGTLMWSESQTVQTDSVGVFSAVMGSVTPIDVALGGAVWLEVEVGGEILSPRREVVSVPYALRADVADRSLDADMLDGFNADAFADSGHVHDDRYYRQTELNSSGSINQGSNPVDWTRLKNVPDGFADGTDDIGGAGDGHSLDAVDGSPIDVVYVDNAGEVGIGTTSPASTLDVRGTLNVGVAATGHDVNFFGATSSARMLWDESKMALRVGDDPGDDWSDANTGYYSAAVGRYVMASGSGSFATGIYQEVSGLNAVAMGEYSYAEGRASVALGSNVSTAEPYSLAAGRYCGTTGGDLAIGTYVIASAGSSFVIGRGEGLNDPLINRVPNSLMVGFGRTEPALFVGGWGNYVGIGTDDPGVPLDTPGPVRIGEGSVWPGFTTGLMIVADDDGSSIPLHIRNQAGDKLFFVRGHGGVGIGESLPLTRCHIRDEDVGVQSDDLQFETVVVEDLDAVVGLYSGDAGNAGSAVSFAEISGGDLADKWGIIRETTRGGVGGGSGLRFTFGTGSDHFVNPLILYLDDTGKVGIGTKSFGAELFRVNGSACATAWNTCSDLRLKENIKDIERALDKVLRLRGVRFSWRRKEYGDRDFPEGAHYGVIAQEAEEVLPEIVSAGPEGERSVAYAEIVPILIESIKELRAENLALIERIEALEGAGNTPHPHRP